MSADSPEVALADDVALSTYDEGTGGAAGGRTQRRFSTPAVICPDANNNKAVSPIDSHQESHGFLILETLGEGVFGETCLYRRLKDKSLVVWKERRLSSTDGEKLEEVETQLDQWLWVHHDNLITFTNYFVQEGSLYLEMEYANAGTLHEKIGIQDSLFGEEMVIWYFFQVVSALAFLQEVKILHRNLNTSSIFLTKSGLVKLGDIGILHVTAEDYYDADGTKAPQNASPEFLEGKQYDVPCDLWALGCVLHELLTLKSLYEGGVDQSIDEEHIKRIAYDVSSEYSEEMRSLLSDLINVVPDMRPGCTEILGSPLFSALGKVMEAKVNELNRASKRRSGNLIPLSHHMQQPPLSVSMSGTKWVLCWGGGEEAPVLLDELQVPGSTAVLVAVGASHYGAVTVNKELYTWSVKSTTDDLTTGELGHGDKSRALQPKKVDALQGIPLKMVSCGNEFTACLTENGTLYAFGSDRYGCLGCDGREGDLVDTPLQVMSLRSEPVMRVSCGENHIIALTQERTVYAWGCGEEGRLGLASTETVRVPTQVSIPGEKVVSDVVAGRDNSFFLTEDGKVLACGSNKDNKLGMNLIADGIKTRSPKAVFEVTSKSRVSLVRPLDGYRVSSLAAGPTHSAAITDSGVLLTFGQNECGQLGTGDYDPVSGICEVGGPLTTRGVVMVACGDGFTVATTKDYFVYSFGNTSDGRLGVAHSLGGHPKQSAMPTPQQVFPTLCHVRSLSCSGASTVVIMEKVLENFREHQESAKSKASSLSCQSNDEEGLMTGTRPPPSLPATDCGSSQSGTDSSDHHHMSVSEPCTVARKVTPGAAVHDGKAMQETPLPDAMVIPPPHTYRDHYSSPADPRGQGSTHQQAPLSTGSGKDHHHSFRHHSDEEHLVARISSSRHSTRRQSLPHNYHSQHPNQHNGMIPHRHRSKQHDPVSSSAHHSRRHSSSHQHSGDRLSIHEHSRQHHSIIDDHMDNSYRWHDSSRHSSAENSFRQKHSKEYSSSHKHHRQHHDHSINDDYMDNAPRQHNSSRYSFGEINTRQHSTDLGSNDKHSRQQHSSHYGYEDSSSRQHNSRGHSSGHTRQRHSASVGISSKHLHSVKPSQHHSAMLHGLREQASSQGQPLQKVTGFGDDNTSRSYSGGSTYPPNRSGTFTGDMSSPELCNTVTRSSVKDNFSNDQHKSDGYPPLQQPDHVPPLGIAQHAQGGVGGGGTDLITPGSSDRRMDVLLERNQELEMENETLKELVQDLQKKNAALSRKVSEMHVTDEPAAAIV